MIKRIIALFAVICMTAALSGCSANPRSSVEYERGEFKFQLSGKYKDDSAGSSVYLFKRNSGNTSIYIGNTSIRCADMKVWLDYTVKRTTEDKYNKKIITSTDIVADLDCNYAAGAVHYKYDDGTGESNYYVENETKGLYISANYDISDKDSVCHDMEELVKSTEYTSNYRTYTGDYKVENDYFSVITPKEWHYNTATFAFTNKNSFSFNKVRARSVEEINTNVMIMTPEESDKSPEEAADEDVKGFKESDYKASRFKSKVFGIEAECVESEVIDGVIVRAFYFEYADLLWHINLNFSNYDELADIEDLLDRIELK